MFKWCPETLNLVKWRGGNWLWPKDGYMKSIPCQTFEGTLHGALEKENIFIQPYLRQSQRPPLESNKFGGSNTTWTLLVHYELSKAGQKSPPKTWVLGDFKDNFYCMSGSTRLKATKTTLANSSYLRTLRSKRSQEIWKLATTAKHAKLERWDIWL